MTAPRCQPTTAHSPLPWIVEPDEREGYEWNVHIVERDRPHMRVCFMTSGPEAETNAYLIVDSLNENATLKARIEELEGALQFIADGYENHNVNHVDYRVKVYQVALDSLQQKAGS